MSFGVSLRPPWVGVSYYAAGLRGGGGGDRTLKDLVRGVRIPAVSTISSGFLEVLRGQSALHENRSIH